MKKFHAGSSRLVGAAAAGAIVMFFSAGAIAQVQPPNNPPAGAYQPIPNFSGPGAGLLFRRAINDRFSGAATIAPAVVRLPLASLPPVVDGMVFFCTDCKRVNPCATGGAGAWAMGARAAWRCAEGPLEADLNVAGRKLTNVAAAGASGEALSYGQSGAVLAGLGASGQKLTGVGAGAAAGDALAFAQAGAKFGDVTDTGATNGSNTISQFSVNGVLNVKAYGAISGSTTNTTGSIAIATPTLTVASATSFAVGQGIYVGGAGAATSLTTPTAPTPTATCDAACTTTYNYKIAALDGSGGSTAASAASSNVSNNATLNYDARYNTLKWTPATGAASYAVYRGTTLIAVWPNTVNGGGGNTQIVFRDYGQVALTGGPDLPTTAAGAARKQSLITRITAVSGTTLTLADNATTTVTSESVYHDDGYVIKQAVTAALAVSNLKPPAVFIPTGTYVLSSSVTSGSAGGGTGNLLIAGAGAYNTELKGLAPLAGLSAVKFFNAWHPQMRDMTINGAVPLLAGVESHINNPALPCCNVGSGAFRDLMLGYNGSGNNLTFGIAFTAANGWDQNNSEQVLRDIWTVGTIEAGIGFLHLNTLQNTINGGIISGGRAGLYFQGGNATVTGTVLGANSSAGNYLLDVGAGTYTHNIELIGVHAEAGASFLNVDAAAAGGNFMAVEIIGSQFSIGGAQPTCVNFKSTTFSLRMVDTQLCEGALGTWNLDCIACTLINVRHGMSALNMNNAATRMVVIGNDDASGAITVTNGVGASIQGVMNRGMTSTGNEFKTLRDTTILNNIDSLTVTSGLTFKRNASAPGTGLEISPGGPCGHILQMEKGGGTDGIAKFSGACPSGVDWQFDTIVNANAGQQVGGGATLLKRSSSTFALNLAAPGAVPGCVDSAAQTLTGVALGNVCSASMSVNLQGAQQHGCFVNAADQVTFRVCQLSGAAADPDGGSGATYRAVVEKY